jgi:hypothetical protein
MNEPYELIEGHEGWITVCAWCYPGEKIFDLFPDMRGKVQVSHGICKSHLALSRRLHASRGVEIKETVMPDSHTEPIRLEILKG